MEIGSFEAKNRLAELLQRAERGEEIVITRRGHAVAKLVPMESRHDLRSARAAADGLRALARSLNLGPFEWEAWKAMRDEGRR